MLIAWGLILKTLFILFIAITSPGPDFVMVLRNSLTFGRRAGLVSALGVACGCLISFSLVIGGLKFLFAYPLAKTSLSLICGAYLIYLGYRSLRHKSQQQHLTFKAQLSAPLLNYFRNGLFTNVFNPKLYSLGAAILTYTEQQHPSLATNLIIISGQSILALLWFSAVSFMFSYSKLQDAYLNRERSINLLLGCIFILIGFRVIFGG